MKKIKLRKSIIAFVIIASVVSSSMLSANALFEPYALNSPYEFGSCSDEYGEYCTFDSTGWYKISSPYTFGIAFAALCWEDLSEPAYYKVYYDGWFMVGYTDDSYSIVSLCDGPGGDYEHMLWTELVTYCEEGYTGFDYSDGATHEYNGTKQIDFIYAKTDAYIYLTNGPHSEEDRIGVGGPIEW